jgi:hypothetical protein
LPLATTCHVGCCHHATRLVAHHSAAAMCGHLRTLSTATTKPYRCPTVLKVSSPQLGLVWLDLKPSSLDPSSPSADLSHHAATDLLLPLSILPMLPFSYLENLACHAIATFLITSDLKLGRWASAPQTKSQSPRTYRHHEEKGGGVGGSALRSLLVSPWTRVTLGAVVPL